MYTSTAPQKPFIFYQVENDHFEFTHMFQKSNVPMNLHGKSIFMNMVFVRSLLKDSEFDDDSKKIIQNS